MKSGCRLSRYRKKVWIMAELTQIPAGFLVCGVKIQIMAIGTTRAKWSTVLIGARLGRYLTVTMPRMEGGAPMKLNEGTQWLLTFINQGVVYSFESQVLGYSYSMEPTLFMRYPTKVVVSNLRANKRYPVNIPLTFLVKQDPSGAALDAINSNIIGDNNLISSPPEGDNIILPSEQMKAVVADISEDGFLLATTFPLAKESIIETVFYLPGEKPLTNILAVCRECRAKPGGYSVGLSYIAPSEPEAMARLNELINKITNSPLRL